MLVRLVKILNDGKYHDGTTLGKKLNMTRSGVWKAIKKLEDYNIKITSIKGKGYALLEPLILLDKKVICKNFYSNIKVDIEIVETISSTSDYLRAIFDYPRLKSKLKICIAEEQSVGRGRLQRYWYSPFAKNIYFSLIYPFQKDVSEVNGLSLVVSLAIIAVCNMFALSSPIRVKWPNDVIYQDKKLAGNLIELQAESHGHCIAIIGIGMNVNMLATDTNEIDQPWISLREILGEYLDRNIIMINLLNILFAYLDRFEKYGLSDFFKEWQEADSLLGKNITLKNISNQINGLVHGIDEHGRLLMKLNDGSICSYSSGEVHILKKI